MIISEQSIIYNSTSQMRQICQPLFRHNITYFEYVRLYKNGKAIKLDTEEELLPYILSNDLYLKPNDIPTLSSNMFMSTHLTDQDDNILSDVLNDYRVIFKLDNFFFLTKEHKEYMEVFVFGADPENTSIINYYLDNIDFLDTFSIYFLEKANDLICSALKERFIFKEWGDHFKENQKESDKLEVRDKLEVKTVYFNLENSRKIQILTYREFQCLFRYIKGESSKIIAISLNISSRTVETHIAKIKKKLMCVNKDQLLRVIIDNGYQSFINYSL